jgi:hypothetical protein
VSLLGAVSYSYIKNKLRRIRYVSVISIIVVFLLFYSFIGLWGHSFAPIHLYDSSINAVEVGERNTDFMRVAKFFTEKIPISRFQTVWTDDYGPLIPLLDPDNYPKILRLSSEYTQSGFSSNELVCAFKDLFLYVYYGRGFSPIKGPQESSRVRCELYEHLGEQDNQIYDDGKYRFWVSAP